MNPFRELGLARTARAPEIKRAYAKLLRQHRPDEDPAGFQRLHECYRLALEAAKRRELLYAAGQAEPVAVEYSLSNAIIAGSTTQMQAMPAGDFSGTPDLATRIAADSPESESAAWPDAPAPDDVPARNRDAVASTPSAHDDSPAEPVSARHEPDQGPVEKFDAGIFFRELDQRGASSHGDFSTWLEQHPALYSLNLKQQVIAPLVDYLAGTAEPPLPQNLAELLRFFRLHEISNRSHWLDQAIRHAEHNASSYWQGESVVARYRGHRATRTERLIFAELCSTRRPWRRAGILLVPFLRRRAEQMALSLAPLLAGRRRQVLDPEALGFWLACGDRSGVSLWRVLAMLASTAFLLGLAALLLAALGVGLFVEIFPVLMTLGALWLPLWWLLSVNDARNFRLQLEDSGQADSYRRMGWRMGKLTPFDRLLISELDEPANGWRRLFLMIAPQSATRLLDLHELSAEDQQSVDARGPTLVFWRHVADLRRLHHYRLTVVALRIAVLSMIVAIVLQDGGPGSSSEILAGTAGILAVVWLVYAIIVLVRLRLFDWQQQHAEHDLRSRSILAFLAGGTVLALTPGAGLALMPLTVSIWLLVVRPGMQARPAALIALFFLCWLGFAVMATLKADGRHFILVLAASCAVILAHDKVFAMRSGMHPAEARASLGWLPHISLAAFVLMCLFFAMLRQ